MKMNYLYELLDSEDLFRIPNDIKSRFAKLTLSKKKEIRISLSENRSKIGKLVGRNIIEELMSDDSSEGEAETINRIFLSKSMQKSKESDEKKLMQSVNTIISDTVEKLIVNDSDVTRCTICEENNDGRPHLQIVDPVLDMERLQVTENIVLTNSDKSFKQQFKKPCYLPVDILSQKISSLEINSPEKIGIEDTVEKTQVISTDSQRKSHNQNFIFNFKTQINQSILTISSVNTSSEKISTEWNDDENMSFREEDVIVITDSDGDEISEYENHVSDIRQSGQTNLCSTLSNTRADRVEAFLHDLEKIPQSQIYGNWSKIIQQEWDDEKIGAPSSKSDESSIPNESIEIAETSTEHEHDKFTDVCESDKDINMLYVDQELEEPLIQTEKYSDKKVTQSSVASSDSSDCEEQISISARFNIKIHFSQPITVMENHFYDSNVKCTKSTESGNNKKSKQTETHSNSNQDSDYLKENKKITTLDSFLSVEKIIKLGANDNASSLDDVDDKGKEILTQLYGNTWQTVDVSKKVDRKTNSPPNYTKSSELVQQLSVTERNNDSINRNVTSMVNQSCREVDPSIADFSIFHKNIRCDLESTRLKSSVKSKIPPREHRTETLPKILKNVEKRYQSVTKSGRKVKKLNSHTSHSNDENDSNNNKCFVSSSDEMQNYSSSDNESFQKLIRKQRKKKLDQNKLIYMDLCTDVVKIVDETIPTVPEKRIGYKNYGNNQEFKVFFLDSNEKLQDVLTSCTFDDKKKIATTPINTLTKRKLYTPQFGNENEYPMHNSPIRSALNLSNEVTLKIPLPSIFAPPLHKQIESVKIGTPIFKMPTPTKNTPKSIKNKEKTKENIRPATPKKLQNIKKTLTDDNQQKTYGFLQSLDVLTPKTLCHPDTLVYRDKFRQTKDTLTDKLYKLFNEKVFDNKLNVLIIWNKKLQNTAGRCCNRKKGNIRFSTVELSEKVLTSADRLRCTLMHELCHAATWIFSGENGHGATWKSWAKKANSILPELPVIGVCHEYDIEYKYTYKCTICAAKSNAHSRSKKVENIRCSYCHGTIEIFLNKKNKDGVIVSTPVKGASGFAKFVQERYKIYKRPNRNHAEVMKILGAEFAVLSIEEKSKF